jgi:HNH endonuclease
VRNEFKIKGDVTEITVRRRKKENLIVLIDTEDMQKMKYFPYRWSANEVGSKTYIFSYNKWGGEKRKSLYIHRFILGDVPKSKVVDHINGNPLDNRKLNLRICSQAENVQNRRNGKKTSAGVRGVRVTKNGRYQAGFRSSGKYHYVGTFDTLGEANKEIIIMRKKYAPYSVPAEEW